MSPILVRPVREQLEHDRIIRLLHAKFRRKYEAGMNPGIEQNMPVGAGTTALYPDLVLLSQDRGRKLQVIVEIETGDHSKEWLEGFSTAVSAMPEVMEVYRMAGDVDYMLRITVPNMGAVDAFYQRLIETVPLKNVTSRFAMERVKYTTAYPIGEH